MPVLAERGVEQVLKRLGVGDLGQTLHALVVVEAFVLHRGHGRVARLALLGAQHLLGVLQRGLHHGDHVEGVAFGFGVEQFERGEQERAQRLVEREILGHVHGGEVVLAAVVAVLGFDDAGVEQRGEDLVGAPMQLLLLLGGLLRVVDEPVHAAARVAALRHLVEHHRVGDPQMRHQRFGCGVDELVERVLVPRHEPLGRLLALDLLELLRVVAGLGDGARVLDLELGGLGHHQAFGIEAHAAGAAGDLMEFAGAQTAHPGPVEFGERGEHHRMNRHVDADAERIRAADDRQQPLLGELFDQPAVARQHTGMVDADAGFQQPLQDLAECGGEARALHRLGDGLALFAAGDAGGGERLRGGQRRVLGEVDDVNRRLVPVEQQFDGVF